MDVAGLGCVLLETKECETIDLFYSISVSIDGLFFLARGRVCPLCTARYVYRPVTDVSRHRKTKEELL